MVKRRLRGQLLSSTTTQRAGKMMVVAGNKTRDSVLKLQFGRFRLTTKTGFIRQHSDAQRGNSVLAGLQYLNGQSRS